MAKTPRASRPKPTPAAEPRVMAQLPVAAEDPVTPSETEAGPPGDDQAVESSVAPPAPEQADKPIEPCAVRWLRMETGISGPAICLTRGDKHPFCDVPAADGGPSEAQRLINAGFAVECDPPTEA